MAALFCEVFVPYHGDGVLFAGPGDAFSVGKFISSFSCSDFRLFDFYFFFLSFYCLSVSLRYLSVCSSTPWRKVLCSQLI